MVGLMSKQTNSIVTKQSMEVSIPLHGLDSRFPTGQPSMQALNNFTGIFTSQGLIYSTHKSMKSNQKNERYGQ